MSLNTVPGVATRSAWRLNKPRKRPQDCALRRYLIYVNERFYVTDSVWLCSYTK